MVKSKRFAPFNKPSKPHPDFPLTPHNNGKWVKKIRGRLFYFGTWDDPDGALREYLDVKDDLLAGRVPGAADNQEGLSVRDLVNAFLTHKKHKLETGELSPQSFGDYHTACARIVAAFGVNQAVEKLKPAHFEKLAFRFPKTWGPIRRGKAIQLVRSVFRYASEQDLIDRPVKFGSFRKPARSVLRIHRAKLRAANGARMFSAAELRQVIAKAGVHFKAMLLLAANTGFGNADVSRLPLTALDLENAWVDFPRPKTGISRRVPLWPETVEALRRSIAVRPKPASPEHGALCFLTKKGAPWVKVNFHQADGKVRVVQDDSIAKELKKLTKKLGMARPGLSFYAIRHGFQTIGEGANDLVAVRAIMGHADDANDMSAHYREGVDDDRLLKVVEHVRAWLFTE
jgi:integrase